VIRRLEAHYHRSLGQVELSTDIVFRRQSDLRAIYGHLTRTAIHAVKPDHAAIFLGCKLTAGLKLKQLIMISEDAYLRVT
jgi:hypothetical protein